MDWQRYPRFLQSETPFLAAEECLFHVIPAPYEKTVSYGTGTQEGPLAILNASLELEAFDGKSCPGESGIYTSPPAFRLETVEKFAHKAASANHIPVTLGGEHTVTLAAVKGVMASYSRLGIIQFDAHADLRSSYQDNPLSHACVMYRLHELDLPLLQIGVRSLSLAENVLRQETASITAIDAEEIGRRGIPAQVVPDDFPENVYITFDVDGLDPSIMPATGTPEPGGLLWWQAMELLERIVSVRNVVGFDVVELAPIKGIHAPDFCAARLAYNVMGMITRKARSQN